MTSLGQAARLLFGGAPARSLALDGFVDSLVQAFENCRPGLTDELLSGGSAPAEAFFLEVYQKEIPRLVDVIRQQEPHLSDAARAEYLQKIDDLVRKVLIPAYVREALRFTPKERNGFYLVPEAAHGLERVLWGGAGMALGAFVVWAPFVPLWEKAWIMPFTVGGLFVPNVRAYLALRRYENQLNELVAKSDREISRIDTAYLTSPESLAERAADAMSDDARRRAAGRVTEGGSL